MKEPIPVAGAQVGRYKLLREVAKGPLGKLYEIRADSDNLGLGGLARVVPIGPELTPEVHQAISDTAWDSMEIRHEYALCVADVVFGENYCVLVHDQAEGSLVRGLQKRAKERQSAFSLPTALRITLDVIEGLEQSRLACDSAQIAWKPGGTCASSLYLCGDGRTRTLDGQLMATLLASKQLSVIAQMPGFPAPELTDSPPTSDERTDVFALGVLLWELLSGRELVLDPLVVQGQKLRQKVPSISLSIPKDEKPIPLGLAKTITSALELDRQYRLGTIAEFKAALRDVADLATYAQVIDFVDNLLHRESTLFRLDLAPPPKLSAQQPVLRSKQPPAKPKQPIHLMDLAKQAQARESALPANLLEPTPIVSLVNATPSPIPLESKPSQPSVSRPAAAKPVPEKAQKTLTTASKVRTQIGLTAPQLPTNAVVREPVATRSRASDADIVTSTPSRASVSDATEGAVPTRASVPGTAEPVASNLSSLIAETVTQAAPAIEAEPPKPTSVESHSMIAGALTSPVERTKSKDTDDNASVASSQNKRTIQLSLPMLVTIIGGAIALAVGVTVLLLRSASTAPSTTTASSATPSASQEAPEPPSEPSAVATLVPSVEPAPSTSVPTTADPQVPSIPPPTTTAPLSNPPPPLGSTVKPTVSGMSAPVKKPPAKRRRQYVPSEL